jgi:hypothetical protein
MSRSLFSLWLAIFGLSFVCLRRDMSAFVMLRNPSDDDAFHLGIQNLLCDMGVMCNVSPDGIIISKAARMNIH